MGRAKRTELDGIVYRSGFEATIAQQLIDAKMPFTFEDKVVIYVEPAQTKKYIPDFMLGNGIIIEGKGRWTVHDRKKIVLVREQNPNLDLRMLFQRDHFLNKGSKTRYSQWCEKRGIPWAVGEVPEEWLREAKAKPE